MMTWVDEMLAHFCLECLREEDEVAEPVGTDPDNVLGWLDRGDPGAGEW